MSGEEGNGDGLDVVEDEFDTFNDDTFGASAEDWAEEDHENLAKLTENEKSAVASTSGFFDDDLGGPDDEPLELQPAASKVNGRQIQADPAVINAGPQMPPMPTMVPPNQNQLLMGQQQPIPEFQDPAIINVGNMPPPPPQMMMMMQQQQQQQQRPRNLQELERDMMQQPPQVDEQQLMRHHQQRLQQQQQQFQQHQHQLQQQQQQQQQFQQQHHHHQVQQHPFQQIQQEQLHQQRMQQQQRQNEHYQHQNQQFQFQQQKQRHQHQQFRQQNQFQQHHQQQHSLDGRRHQYYNKQQDQHRNYSRHNTMSHGSFDEKDRETFGDDFVSDHHKQQKEEQRRSRNLIMPGHVHVLGILRGARQERRGVDSRDNEEDIDPTGNPQLDLERQLERENRHRNRQRNHYSTPDDEYSGLMSQRDRQWIINIQMNQLKDEHDYYYTVVNQKKKAKEEGLNLRPGRHHFFGEDDTDLDLDLDELSLINRRTDDETQLLLKSESAAAVGSPRDEYMPKQFSNSLGKLQAVTVKAPRKIIDLGVINSEAEVCSSSAQQKDSRNYKKTLMELERLYSILIDVEDCEKKVAALPTGTPLRAQAETEGKEGIRTLGSSLVQGDNLKRYLLVRKGKSLLIRALRWLDQAQMRVVCTTLLQLYPLATRRDRDDGLLSSLWSAGIRKHLVSIASLALLQHYLILLAKSSKQAMTSPLGVSFVVAVINQMADVHDRQPKADVEATKSVILALGEAVEASDHWASPLPGLTNSNNEVMSVIFAKEDEAKSGYSQIKRLLASDSN